MDLVKNHFCFNLLIKTLILKRFIMVLRQYTRVQVTYHDSAESCWIIINEKIYDVTPYIQQHPGGGELLLEYGGHDATSSFSNKPHSLEAMRDLSVLLCGVLIDN